MSEPVEVILDSIGKVQGRIQGWIDEAESQIESAADDATRIPWETMKANYQSLQDELGKARMAAEDLLKDLGETVEEALP